jgi:putative transposase
LPIVLKLLFFKNEKHTMANTYTQIHIQAIFAVQNRECLIQKEWQEELYRYITGIIQNHDHKLLQINGMPDHLHIFFGMRPNQSLSDLMKKVKGDSSAWINEKGFLKSRFSWQAGYGAFSYGKSQVSKVIQYIESQEEHHKTKTFLEEYIEFLNAFEIEYEEKFIFKSI